MTRPAFNHLCQALLGAALLTPAASAQEASEIYFGDLHVHTRLSFDARLEGGTTTGPDQACRHAREVSRLDFVGLSDHSEGFGDALWRDVYVPVIEGHNDELDETVDGTGRFVTLIGYEWTSRTYGHRNVFFRTGAVPDVLYDSINTAQVEDSSSPPSLWALLDAWKAQAGNGADYISIPHTMAEQFDWDPANMDGDRQPIAEIFSKHGSSQGNPDYFPTFIYEPDSTWESGLNRWLHTRLPGYQLGAIASSDTHDGEAAGSLPALEQLDFGPERPDLWTTTGGLVAVHADALTREAIFDGLQSRHCYGTSGPRIRLWLHAQTDNAGPLAPMGSQVTYRDLVRLHVRALGDTAPIMRIVVFRGAVAGELSARPELAAVLTPDGDGRASWTDPAPPASHAYYYVVAFQEPTLDYANQSDEVQTLERAWSSPIFAQRAGE